MAIALYPRTTLAAITLTFAAPLTLPDPARLTPCSTDTPQSSNASLFAQYHAQRIAACLPSSADKLSIDR